MFDEKSDVNFHFFISFAKDEKEFKKKKVWYDCSVCVCAVSGSKKEVYKLTENQLEKRIVNKNS